MFRVVKNYVGMGSGGAGRPLGASLPKYILTCDTIQEWDVRVKGLKMFPRLEDIQGDIRG
jgi:hypothetical protein